MWRGVRRNGLIFAAGGALMAVLQVVYRLLAIRGMTVHEYGEVAIIISVFNAISLAGQAGVPVATARFTARGDGEGDLQILRAAARAMALPCLAASLGMLIVTLVVTHSHLNALIALGGMAPMILSTVFASYLQGKGRIVAAASVQPTNTVVQLVALGALLLVRSRVSVGEVMDCFYVGNVGALAVAGILLARHFDPAARPLHPGRERVSAGRILNFSLWLSLSTLATFLLPVIARVALVHLSYRQVALFDVALLLYSLVERLAAALVNALIPLAAVEQRDRRKVSLPARHDIALATLCTGALAWLLWQTHALRHLLVLAGLRRYVPAEGPLLIILVAAPCDMAFMVNAGLLSAFGRTARLAAVSGGVLAVTLIALPFAAARGASYLSATLVAAYVSLYAVSSFQLSLRDVTRESISSRPLRTLRSARRLRSRGIELTPL